MDYEANVAWTAALAANAHELGVAVEAELGKLAGEEDGLSVPEVEAKMTDPQQVPDFLFRTRADVLAVTVGNVHGRYAKKNPRLDIVRLGHVQAAASGASCSPLLRVLPTQVDGKYKNSDTLLAIHGASGLPSVQVQASVSHGVCKFNVNTEVRTAAVDFFEATGLPAPGGEQGKGKGRVDLLAMLDGSVACMREVIEHKMLEFDPR